jgi:hypothetical protein
MDPVKGSLSIAETIASESWHSRAERLLGAMHPVFSEVLRCGIDWCAEPVACLRLRSHSQGADVELDLAVAPRNNSDLPQSPLIRHDRPTPENRLELRLAQELVAGWGGTLEVLPTSPNFLVRLLIPSAE